MTDIDFPALIARGAEVWNQWRADHPTERPDLSRAYLYNQTLVGFDLSHTNLERACLIGANLHAANLSGACLQSVYASSSDFSSTNLTGADLSHGGFSEAIFSDANLSAASAIGTEFAGADFTGACFVALQVDRTTSFNEVRGGYLYLQPPPAGRSPQVGQFQSGELAAFLQRTLTPGVIAPLTAPYPRLSIALSTWRTKLIPIVTGLGTTASNGLKTSRQLWQQWYPLWCQWLRHSRRRLLRRFLVWSRRLARRCRTEWLPALRRLWHSGLRLCQYWQIQVRRKSRTANARFLQIRPLWAEFISGQSQWQRSLTAGQQGLQSQFHCASRQLRVNALRQRKYLHETALMGGGYSRQAIARTRRYLNQSPYFQSVFTDLKAEYRRYSLPLLAGAVGAITLFLFVPLAARLGRDSAPTSATVVSPVESAMTQTSMAVDSTSADIDVPEDMPELDTPPASRVASQVAASVESAPVSLSLPCPAVVTPLAETTAGYRYQDGSIFYGEVVNGQPADGRGTMTYPTGNQYDGDYEKGQRNGCGTFSFQDGRRYVGQFKADEFHGLGTWILENGERYIGEFEDNQCSGQGSFIYANGSVESGMWQEGKLAGTNLSCERGSLRVPTSSDIKD